MFTACCRDGRPTLTALRGEGSSGKMCPSFMQFHIALELTEDTQSRLPHGTLEPNYVSIEYRSFRLEYPDNVVLISVPSVLEKDVCPAGQSVLHA
ncbi:hypothetical protein FGB62_150g05 [Gracilaria domingensis]|nr:hypothetical protein FGB62_150g05 [Gracilaria domingensis]